MFTREQIRIGTLVKGAPDGATARYIEQILPYGFESISITFWQSLGGTNLKQLAGDVQRVLDGTGVVVSTLGIFGNPLGKEALDKETLKCWRALIDHADRFDCDMVAGFTGRVRNQPIPKSLPVFKRTFGALADRAAAHGVKLAFENCSMGGTWAAGDWNIAHNPAAWDLMFKAVPHENVGLQWEPCHQMVQLIDPLPTLRAWVHRVFNVHGKDATISWDLIRQYGIHGPKPCIQHRTPGFGDSNWADIITVLREAGYQGSIDIEGWHDPVYRDELEMTGQVHALHYLKQCRGGTFIENPS
jgi:sugar phosphate isomerase/epimerase